MVLHVKNWASTGENQTMGSLGQYGGNVKETVWKAYGGEWRQELYRMSYWVAGHLSW